jgi:hypothetical protein
MPPAATNGSDPATVPPNEAAILSKLFLRPRGGLTKHQARYLAGLGFSEEDKERMKELARKNREGCIPSAELNELDSYIKVGDLLAILQSQARKFLKAK